MPIRIPHHHVTVQRDGKNVSPPIGQAFDFTTDEVVELMDMHPNALRRPITEGAAARPAASRKAAAAEVTSDEPVDDLDEPADGDPTPAARAAAARKAPAKRPAAVAEEEDDAL